ncbi:hypothetical protein STEG23_038034, partial [Scotinomys teguina]
SISNLLGIMGIPKDGLQNLANTLEGDKELNSPRELPAEAEKKLVLIGRTIQEEYVVLVNPELKYILVILPSRRSPTDSWTLVQLPVLDLRINLHPSLDKGLMTTGDPVSWAPERTTQESSGPSPPDYSSVISVGCRALMEYYAAEKNNDSMKFAGKWMELENVILSEVTQTQEDKYGIYSLIGGY